MTLAGEQVLVNQLIDAVALRVGVGCGFKINVDFQMEQRYQRALVFTGLESLDPAVAWLWIGAEHDAASRRELIAGLRCVPIIYFQTRVQLCHFGLNRRTVLHHKQKKKERKKEEKIATITDWTLTEIFTVALDTLACISNQQNEPHRSDAADNIENMLAMTWCLGHEWHTVLHQKW